VWQRNGILIGLWWESQKERDHHEDVDVSGRITLRWITEKEDGVLWTGFIWRKIGTSGELCEHGNEPSGSVAE
jgi:hypothetical protein